jgi:hypothetical protein
MVYQQKLGAATTVWSSGSHRLDDLEVDIGKAEWRVAARRSRGQNCHLI